MQDILVESQMTLHIPIPQDSHQDDALMTHASLEMMQVWKLGMLLKLVS
jgi:hypothetical protein